MADTKISALPAVVTAAGTDVFPVVQGGATKQETLAQALTWIQTQVAPVAAGGTGFGTYTIGDLLIADGAASLARLADVATGNALIAGGVGVAPTWGKVGLTTHVSGVLPSANGGTGVNNAGTITNATNTTITGGGTLALGGFTLTVPATGTAALLATANVFSAAQAIAVNDAVTNTVTTLATLTHNSSGTPAASFGSRLLFNLDSATVDDRNAFAMDVIWTTATDASRSSAMLFSAVSAAGALTEMFRVGPATVTVPAANGITFGSAGSAIVSVASSFLRMQGTSGVGVSLYANSAEKVRVLATGNGNMGVGHLTPATQLHVATTDAVTAAVTSVLTVGHNSSGTAAAGFGVATITQLDSSTTDDTTVADETATWVVATHASRTARVVRSVYDTAARVTITEEASGSAAMIGFLGANAAIRQTGGAATASGSYTATEQGMIQKAYDALRTFGFLT